MPWLAGDTPTTGDTICRLLRIPNSPALIAAVEGAIDDMAYPNKWEQNGSLSPVDASALMYAMFEQFISSGDWCMLGSVFPFASASVPEHCLECDGATYLRTDYPSLYAALDVAFILDADHFQTPAISGRVVVAVTPTGTPPFVVGQTGGEYEHILSVGELATHTHSDSGHDHSEGTTSPVVIPQGGGVPVPASVGAVGTTATGFAALDNAGSSDPHNNTQPYIALRYAIVSE